MNKRKSSIQIKAIDKYISETCPIHGADFCAQQLCESLQYVKGRIKTMKIGKLKVMRSEADMEQRIEYLIGLNKELRLENMKIKRGVKV